MRITEIATRDLSKWVSGDIRFTPREKELLTNQAAPSLRTRTRLLPNSPFLVLGSPLTASAGVLDLFFPVTSLIESL